MRPALRLVQVLRSRAALPTPDPGLSFDGVPMLFDGAPLTFQPA